MPSGNEVTVTVSNASDVAVTVPGSTGTTPTIANGGTANVTITSVGDRGPKGDTGPATTLTIGTVTGGTTAAATLTGTAPNQTLNLVLPKGDTGSTGSTGATGSVGATGATGPAGPANSLSVGTVTTGAAGSSASATITGAAPTQTLSLTIPRGDVGATGATGPTGPANSLAIGTVTTVAAGGSASATITGTAPNQTLNLTIPRGDKGTDGSDVEFQSNGTYLQWRYVGGSTWTNLVPLSSITGPANSLSIGTTTTGAAGSAVSATITGTAPNQTLNLTIPRGDVGATGATGSQGPTGTFGTPQDINAQTGDYTLVLADAGKLITVSAGSSDVTITVPTNTSVAFPVGTHIDIARLYASTVVIQGDDGVVVNATPGRKLRANFSTGTLIKIGTNAWLLVGDLST